MEWFLTRVELHNANEGDYATLHDEMERRHFYRFIKSDQGRAFQLPTAEYFSKSETLSPEDVRDIAIAAADATGKANWVLTVRYDFAAWSLRPINRSSS
ncbi:hypothetical protein [Frateuria sp.]|uniref:hypothetical protein n=1 Tax=Frateuria sp. TaxID=2211372 RepID=UPI003F7DA016